MSAVHNVRLDAAARAVGLAPSFGQSPFAIARGNAFEASLFYDEAARLRAALERKRCLPANSVGFVDLRLRMNGGRRVRSVDEALALTADWLHRLAGAPDDLESVVAAPMIRIPKGVVLPEALLIIDVVTVVVGADGRPRITVGEIKSFPDRGGHTSPRQLATARAQAGIYRHALELTLAHSGLADDVVLATDGFLVFTWPGSNAPSVRVGEDLTYQAIRAERGFERLEEVAQAIVRDDDFSADQPALVARVLEAPTDYVEGCLSFCDLAPRCHAAALAADDPVVLGDEVGRLLGSTTLTRAVELANGAPAQDAREQDLQRLLRLT